MANIFGYDSFGDMFDGGGPGQSGDTFDNDNDPNNKVTGIAAVSNTVTGNSAANNPNSNNNDNSSGSNTTAGGAPSGGILSFVNPVSIIGKLAGWANGLDPDADRHPDTINGRQYYTNKDGMVYTYNAIGLPYEVVQGSDGNFVDKLSVVDETTGLTGYQQLAQDLKDKGDDEGAAKVLQEAEQNADNVEPEKSVTEQVLEWAKSAGIDEAGMEAIRDDPNKFLSDRNLKLEDIVPTLDAEAKGTSILGDSDKYQLDIDGLNQDATTVGDSDIAQANTVNKDGSDAVTYTAETNTEKMEDGSYDMDAATGTIDDDNLVDSSKIEIDMTGAATGTNVDGTTNEVGVAVNDYATQKFSTIIDTSTVSGKNLAKALGEGNYLDEKATIAGQMKIISEQFVNDQGQAVIPKWAQKIARSVAQTIAFDGITGSAQTSAMATAIMEATLGIAEKEATFFQTLTTKNLDNRQQAIINKANVLARFEEANLGARQAAAVANAKAFLEMDLKNLTNEQQAALINKQERTQALFEDSKIINAQRLFTAEQTNDFNKFYDELNAQIQKHNATEMNNMKKFNVGEINDMKVANAELQNNREKFYQEMQYNIDTSNAKWRREVTLKQFETTWEAISTDVKNTLDISTEAQNRLWDTAENLLDFIQKTASGDRDAELRLLIAQMQQQGQETGGSGFLDGLFKLGGTFLGLSEKPWWLK